MSRPQVVSRSEVFEYHGTSPVDELGSRVHLRPEEPEFFVVVIKAKYEKGKLVGEDAGSLVDEARTLIGAKRKAKAYAAEQAKRPGLSRRIAVAVFDTEDREVARFPIVR